MSLQLRPDSMALLAKLELDPVALLATAPPHQRPEYTTAIHLSKGDDATRPGPLSAWVYHLSGRIDLKTGNYAQAYDFFQKTLRIQEGLGHQVGMIYALDGIACALVQLQQFAEGACLLGAAETLCKQQQLLFPPFDRADSEHSLAMLRQVNEPVAWRTAWAEGQTLSLEQSVAKTLSMVGRETYHETY